MRGGVDPGAEARARILARCNSSDQSVTAGPQHRAQRIAGGVARVVRNVSSNRRF